MTALNQQAVNAFTIQLKQNNCVIDTENTFVGFTFKYTYTGAKDTAAVDCAQFVPCRMNQLFECT